MIQMIIDRLDEPSTYAGIAALLGSLGVAGMGTDGWTQIFGYVAAIAGGISSLVAILKKEKGVQ